MGVVAGAYNGLTELFTDTERLARGQWSTPAEDPTTLSGYRRYGASKLCQIMFMFVDRIFITIQPAKTS